jgi:hypothetical protein
LTLYDQHWFYCVLIQADANSTHAAYLARFHHMLKAIHAWRIVLQALGHNHQPSHIGPATSSLPTTADASPSGPVCATTAGASAVAGPLHSPTQFMATTSSSGNSSSLGSRSFQGRTLLQQKFLQGVACHRFKLLVQEQGLWVQLPLPGELRHEEEVQALLREKQLVR